MDMEESYDASTPPRRAPADASPVGTQHPAHPGGEAIAVAMTPSAAYDGARGDDSGTWDDAASDSRAMTSRTWEQELPRWLASLNPGRTQREYEKAVGYFFQTPGVPPELDALTIDLLLAYRGALALRATPHVDGPPPPRPQPSQHSPTLAAGLAMPALGPRLTEPEERDTRDTDERGAYDGGSSHQEEVPFGPLAPATVNVRLTALRQFLTHCTLFGVAPDLPPERIRAALRRLRVERRRPYQVLAEPEWESFLATARQPIKEGRRSPWGRPRRAESASTVEGASRGMPAATEATKRGQQLTGARTAERDHALIALALATGLRAVELAALDVGDLTREWHAGQEEWWLVLPDAKTKGQRGGRTLPLASETVEGLRRYLNATGRSWERANDRATPLFLSGRKGTRRLTPSSIGRVVDRVERQWQAQYGDGDARRISPHALRHSTAIALLEGNTDAGRPPASVEHVRGWLGHFDIRTTQGYLAHLDARRHRRPFALTPRSVPAAAPDAKIDGDPQLARETPEGTLSDEAGQE